MSPVKKSAQTKNGFEPIAPVINRLSQEYPDSCLVLFGSRAGQTHARYADWDVGVFSKDGLSHPVYRRLLRLKNEMDEHMPFFIDLVNLNVADAWFLKQVLKDVVFLAGRWSDWLELKEKHCG